MYVYTNSEINHKSYSKVVTYILKDSLSNLPKDIAFGLMNTHKVAAIRLPTMK